VSGGRESGGRGSGGSGGRGSGVRAGDLDRPAGLGPDREVRIAELAVLGVMALWGANFIVVKAANEQIPPVAFAMLRFGSAALILLAILRWREGGIGLPRRDLLPLLALGGLGFGIYQILWATALQDIAAGDSALLIAATPVLVALFAVVAGSDTLTRLKLAGAIISFIGVALVIAGGTGLTLGSTLIGDLVTLLAAACWAGYTAFAAPFLRRVSPLRTTAWAMIGGTLVLVPIGLTQLVATDLATVETGSWLGLAYSALLPAGLANVIVFQAVRLVGPTRITAFQSLVPAFAVIIAALFLAEPIHAGQVVGGAVIVVGVWLTRRPNLVVPRFRPRPRAA